MLDEFKAATGEATSPARSRTRSPAETMGSAFAFLRERGWASMALAPDQSLRSLVPLLRPGLADQIASIQIERVSPKTPGQARPGTMSAIYGMGSFPLHTERAHWRIPPRFVIFRSVGDASDRPTTLLDSYRLSFDRELVQQLLQTQWIVEWDEARFRSPVLSPLPGSDGRWQARFDRCCMRPDDGAPEGLSDRLELALEALEPEEHYWKPEIALVVDNWRVLHGRGDSGESDFGRSLERIVVP